MYIKVMILYTIPYSMWSEIARWSLLLTHKSFQEKEHTVLLGELALRVRARSMHASVPLLVGPSQPVMGALEIARWADDTQILFVKDHEQCIAQWTDRALDVCRATRSLAGPKMRNDSDFLAEALPPYIPGFMRNLMAPSTKMGLAFLGRKHGYAADDLAAHEATLRQFQDDIMSAVAANGYLCGGQFTFADLVCAASLEFVMPVADKYIPIGAATRKVLTSDLAPELAPLIAWRDKIYREHRPV